MHLTSIISTLALAASAAIADNAITNLGSFSTAVTGSTTYGALAFDGSGNLYGTTSSGGANGGGTVFHVGAGTITPVVSFTGVATSGSFGGLTYDSSAGVFYGTVRGLNSTTTPVDGSVFSYNPTTSAFTTLHTFAASGADGSQVAGPVTLANGTLYGSTQFGGTGSGSLFTLSGTTKTDFTQIATPASNVTLYPSGNLVVDASGNVYGTSGGNGGSSTGGTAFQYSASTSTASSLYGFSRFSQGNSPRGGLIADSSGTLYGMTTESSQFGGNPVIFSLSGTTHTTFTALATFSSTSGLPSGNWSTLVMDAYGNLYGTTTSGGAYGYGTVFELTKGSTSISVLYNFTNGTLDGGKPVGGLLIAPDGSLYGTTSTGGANGSGTVFNVVPEPTSLAILGLGAAGILARRRKGSIL